MEGPVYCLMVVLLGGKSTKESTFFTAMNVLMFENLPRRSGITYN